MFLITKEIEFDAGHRVPGHSGKCRSPHGHRYRVQLQVVGSLVSRSGDSSEGMVADFGDIKSLLTTHIHDVLDHGMIAFEGDNALRAMYEGVSDEDFKLIIFPYIPTAENIAKWCFDVLQKPFFEMFSQYDIEITAVQVWETPTSTAKYLSPFVDNGMENK